MGGSNGAGESCSFVCRVFIMTSLLCSSCLRFEVSFVSCALRFDCSCSAPALHSAWSDLSVTLSCCKFCTSLFVFSSCTVTFSWFLAALADLVSEGLSDRGGGVVGEDLLFWFHQLHLLQG